MSELITRTNGDTVSTAVGTLKKLEVMIRPGKLEAVKRAMASAGYTGVTISQAEGHGNQKGLRQQHEGETYHLELLPKIRLEVVVAEHDLEPLAQAIVTAAHTGQPGDGKIFVSDVREVIRIRTGERGAKAL